MSYLHIVAAAVGACKTLERECPDCGAKQIVAPSQGEAPVNCPRCGALISARPEAESQSLPP